MTARRRESSPGVEGGKGLEFAIFGAGAMGSILGAHLIKGGHSVAMIARGERAHHIERNGLQIRGLVDFSVPARLVREPSEIQNAKVLIVALKTPGSAQALGPLREVPFSTVFSIQNGLYKNQLMTECFGRGPVLGALADTSGELLESGEVLFTRNVRLMLGELSGELSPRARDIAGMLDTCGIKSVPTENILGFEWSKFCVWAGMMALSVITRTCSWKYLADPASALLLARAIRELGSLAMALGIELTDESVLPVAMMCLTSESRAVEAVLALGARFEHSAPRHRMSSLQDFEAHKPLEIEETLGFALREAGRLGRSVPTLEFFYNASAAIDRINRMSSDG